MVNHTAQSSNISVRAELSAAVAGLVRASSKLPSSNNRISKHYRINRARFSEIFPDFQGFELELRPDCSSRTRQCGFTAPELANLQSPAVTQGGIATRNAQQAAGERAAAAGGGTTIFPNGATLGMNANIAEAGAAQTAGNLANINLQNRNLADRIGFRLRASLPEPPEYSGRLRARAMLPQARVVPQWAGQPT